MLTTAPDRVIGAAELRDLVGRVLAAGGADGEAAALVAGSLVLANLRGVDSHGAMRVPDYLDAVRGGRIVPDARPSVAGGGGPLVRVDGNRCFGQLAAREATLAAVEGARRHGVGVAVVAGVLHIGRLGEFVEQAAASGCVSLLLANGGPPGGLVAPFGGRSRALGTNPLAFGVPAGRRPPIVADFSTSVAAEGKVRLLREAGRLLPDGWLLDRDGNPSVDPADLYAGGALLPAGGHKGFALGLLVEILGGVLAGEGCAVLGEDPGNGCVLIALDPAAVLPAPEFARRVDEVIAAVEGQPPRAGLASVVVPGAPEAAVEAQRRRDGIPFSADTWQRLAEGARSVGIDLEGEELRRVRDTG
jgi:LDH2 family malate/lactate/ureidoglycolate dehydrogenase